MTLRGAARWMPFAFAALAFLFPLAAKAQDLDLVWQAPDSCPSGDQVKSDFRRSLRLSPGHVPPALSATGVVDHTGGRWALHLHIVRNGAGSDRDIEADSCASLARAAALVLTLALGEGDIEEAAAPEAVSPSPQQAPQPPPAPPPSTVEPVIASAGPSEAPAFRRPRHVTWSPALDARTAWGPTPGPALGVGAGVDVRSAWWGISARAESWPSVTQTYASGLQTSFEGIGGALSFCAGASPSLLLLSLCGGLEASAVRGTSSPGAAVQVKCQPSCVAPWYAALFSLRARVPVVDAVHLELGVELAVSFTRPQFEVGLLANGVMEGLAASYEVPELSPSVIAGVSYDL